MSASELENANEFRLQKLTRAKATRTGKLSSLTRRVNKARKIMAEQGSRTELKSLQTVLLQSIPGIVEQSNKVFIELLNSEAELVAAEEWISQAIEKAQSCIEEVKDHLEERADENPSEQSVTGTVASRKTPSSRVSASKYSSASTTARAREMSRKAQLDALKASQALGAAERQIQRDQQAAQQVAQQIIAKAQEQAGETKKAAIRAASVAELSRVESNLLHNDTQEERGEELQNRLKDFENEPLTMDAPPLGLPLHQSYVQPTILPTQRPCRRDLVHLLSLDLSCLQLPGSFYHHHSHSLI